MRRRLLITGGAGFIGSHFVEHCLQRQLAERVVVLDALTYAGNPAHLDAVRSLPAFRFVHGDICDQSLVEQLLLEERLDSIVNFAAETHVDRSIAASGVFVKTNVEGVRALLEAARRVWCSASGRAYRFHQVSTDEVFGAAMAGASLRDESALYAPGSPYAASKAAADHLVRAWRNTYGLPVSISYSSNVYGPRQHAEKFIPVIVRSLLSGAPVPVYGDGGQSRGWLHVRDLCRALELLLAHDTEGRSLHLGATRETGNLELVRRLCVVAGRRAEEVVRFVPDRPGHDRCYAMSAAAFEALTGFAPEVRLESGLVETFDWYRAQYRA